jgi:UDP-N-acetylmuramate dehydrogenase
VTAPIVVAADVLGDRARRDAPLGALTTYRVGGTAALLVQAESVDDLELARRAIAASGLDVIVVGKGSNMLVADAGFDGLAVVLGDGFGALGIEGTRATAGGAVALPVLARRTAAAGLTGLEWAVGVPGSVGGGVRMNAGGHGADIAASLVQATLVDLAGEATVPVVVAPDDLDLGYRHSSVTPTQVVVEAEFRLEEGDRVTAEARISEIVQWRREHQPGGQNAGSVFTNPPDDSAGRVVDDAGLRGFRLGTACVSDKHANFIQADNGGSADDVLALIRAVQERVEKACGVTLVPEVKLVGFP